jgi:hypothetical protein
MEANLAGWKAAVKKKEALEAKVKNNEEGNDVEKG